MRPSPTPANHRRVTLLILLVALALGVAALCLSGCGLLGPSEGPAAETPTSPPPSPTGAAATATPAPPSTLVPAAYPTGYPTPAPILYQMYDWGTDFQTLRPELGPVGSINFVTWEEVNPSPGVYNWGAIERLLAREEPFKVTLLDGRVIQKPVVIQVFAYLSSAPNWSAADFYDATPTWVYDRIDQATPGSPRPVIGGRKVGYLLTGCGKKAVVPMYDSSIWREAYYDMIRAFGQRFEGSPQVASVTVLTGIDGETHATKDWYCAWQTEILAQQAPGVSPAFLDFCKQTMAVYRQAFPRTPLYVASAPGSSGARKTLAAYAATFMPPIGLKHCGLITDLDSHQGYGTFVGSWDMVRAYSTTLPIWVESVYTFGSRETAYWSLLAGLHYHPQAMDLHEPNFDSASPEMLHFAASHLGVTLADTPSVWTVLRDMEFPLQSWGSGGVSGHAGDWCFWLTRSDDAPQSRTSRVWRQDLPTGRESIYGRQSRRTLQSESQLFISLDIADGYPYVAQAPLAAQANGVHYIINVTLLNYGNDTFALQYRAANGDLVSQVRQKGPTLGPVNDWVSVRFEVTDGYLANNLPGACDLRLSCEGDGDEYVHMVQVVGGRGTPPPATPTPTQVPRPTPTATLTPLPGPTPTPETYAGLAPTPTPLADAARFDPVADTFLDRWSPSSNRASDSRLSARQNDVRASALRFDLTALPSDAIVDRAVLSLCAVARSNPQPLRLAAYKVYRVWDEAQCDWELASASSAWAVPGCNDTLLDRSSVSVADALVSRDNYWYSLDITALVRDWVSDPTTNAGVALKAEGAEIVQYDFYASNSAEAAMRPRLWVVARTLTPTPSATPTPSSTPTLTATPTDSATPTPTATATPAEIPSVTPTARPYPWPPTQSPSATAAPEVSVTPTPAPSATLSVAPTDTPGEMLATNTPGAEEPSPTLTLTLSASQTPTPSPSAPVAPTAILTVAPTATPSPSMAPSSTRTALPGQTPTPTVTVTASATPSPSITPTAGLVRAIVRAGDDASQVADTYLDAFAPDGNMSTANKLLLRQGSSAAPLFWFNLAAIPERASVKAATLHLYVVARNHPGAVFASVAQVIRRWDASYVSWNRSTATDGWAQPGASGIGHDRLERAYASCEIEGERLWATWEVSALVQEWVSSPSANLGLLILGQGSAPVEYELAASEWELVAYRPYLEIEYDRAQPSPTPSITSAPSATPTATPVASVTHTVSPLPTSRTPTPSRTSATPVAPATPVASPSATLPGPSVTVTRTPTAAPTLAPTHTPMGKPTAMPTVAPTHTPTAPTSTPVPTPASGRLVLQEGLEGYTGAADTYLDAWQQDGNYGRSRELYVRQGREQVTLLRYDLAQVPTGARVTDATLSLWVAEVNAATEASLALYELRRPWNADAATWLESDLGVLWSAPGASAPENDRAVASLTVAPLSRSTGWVTVGVTDVVQRWVQNPPSNAGLLMRVEGQASPLYRLASSQSDDAAQRPKLVLRYTLSDAPLREAQLALLPWLGVAVVLLGLLYLLGRSRSKQPRS